METKTADRTTLDLQLLEKHEIHLARTLLEAYGLPSSDIDNRKLLLFALQEADRTLAVGGFEKHGAYGILRSVAITFERQREGLGSLLVDSLEKEAARRNIRVLYLVTTDADVFFSKRGYVLVDMAEVPDFLLRTNEFQQVFTVNGICMRKALI